MLTEILPRDSVKKCPKCGYSEHAYGDDPEPEFGPFKTEYVPEKPYKAEVPNEHSTFPTYETRYRRECLKRTCPQCGYKWAENCADAEEGEAPSLGQVVEI